jgi:hypothetical protein
MRALGLVLRAALMIPEPELPPPLAPPFTFDERQELLDCLEQQICCSQELMWGYEWESQRYFYEGQRLSIFTPDQIDGQDYYRLAEVYGVLALEEGERLCALEQQRCALIGQ